MSQRELDRADLRIEPGTEFSVSSATSSFQDRPAPMSLTIHSSYHLAHDAPGVIAECPLLSCIAAPARGVLFSDAVPCVTHEVRDADTWLP